MSMFNISTALFINQHTNFLQILCEFLFPNHHRFIHLSEYSDVIVRDQISRPLILAGSIILDKTVPITS